MPRKKKWLPYHQWRAQQASKSGRPISSSDAFARLEERREEHEVVFNPTPEVEPKPTSDGQSKFPI